MNRLLFALLAGGAAYGLTREVVVGLLAAGGVWFFWRTRRPTAEPGSFDSRPAWTPKMRRHKGIEVICKQVTPERQEWVSVRTGRLYDVLSASGPVDARPGDHAYVVPTPSGYRISPAKSTES